jgi:hypothetical protein
MLGRLANLLPFSGWGAASAQYRQQDLSPFVEYGWSHVDARRNRYAIYTAYDYNSIYSGLHAFTQTMKETNRLYKYIRGVYNPVSRQKQVMSANVYQGAINRTYLKAGAMPLDYENEALTTAIQNIVKWSNLEQKLGPFTEHACVKGDTAWWIVDEPSRGRVRMEPMNPGKIYDAEFDDAGNVKAATIQYMRMDEIPISERGAGRINTSWYDAQSKPYLFTMNMWRIAGGVRFETYKDEALFPLIEDEDGTRRSTWDAPYPFVPLKIASFMPSEGHWGVNGFYNCIDKINAVNDAATLVLDQVRKVVVAILKAKGIRKESLHIDMQNPSGLPIFFIDDPEADVEPLVSQLDLVGAQAIVKDAIAEVEKDMPELMFGETLGRNERPTEPGLRAATSMAVGRIEMARRNLDPCTAAALQMAATIGGIRGYDGFDGIDERTYDRGDMELRIIERPVIADTLSAKERVTFYPQIASLPVSYQRAALKDMGKTEPEIEEIVSDPLLRLPATTGQGAGNGTGERVEQARLRLGGFSDVFESSEEREGAAAR